MGAGRGARRRPGGGLGALTSASPMAWPPPWGHSSEGCGHRCPGAFSPPPEVDPLSVCDSRVQEGLPFLHAHGYVQRCWWAWGSTGCFPYVSPGTGWRGSEAGFVSIRRRGLSQGPAAPKAAPVSPASGHPPARQAAPVQVSREAPRHGVSNPGPPVPPGPAPHAGSKQERKETGEIHKQVGVKQHSSP